MIIMVTVVALATTVISCCPRASDPHTGGFIGGLQGIFCGDYDRRIEQRQSDLSQENELTQKLQADFNVREKEYKLKVSELHTEQQRMKELDKYIKRLLTDINLIKAKSVAQRTKMTDLKSKIKNLQTEIDDLNSNGGSVVDPELYRVLEKKRDILASEYKALLEYFNSLSNVTN